MCDLSRRSPVGGSNTPFTGKVINFCNRQKWQEKRPEHGGASGFNWERTHDGNALAPNIADFCLKARERAKAAGRLPSRGQDEWGADSIHNGDRMARRRNVKAWLITWEGDHGRESN